jgi:hypothetical protein
MMINWIDKMFKHAFEKEWFLTYWAFDVHGTILIPTLRKDSFDSDFYPWAKETLQLISKREDIIMILYTSSYPVEIQHYLNVFKENDINFHFVNVNTEIDSSKGNFGFYRDKFYFNALFEDKAGFRPDTEWEAIYNLLKEYEEGNNIPNPDWLTKF